MDAQGMSIWDVSGSEISIAANVGAGVYVGRRVVVGWMTNCAARVGSIVDVAGGTGVGGGSTT